MQEIIVEKPYRFIPPHRGNWAPSCIQAFRLVDWYLNRFCGIVSYEVRGIEFLNESLHERAGILLTPNHCRYADPIAMGWLVRQAKVHVYAMASWHLFHQNWLQALAIQLCGGFSVNREGVDRQSLETAIDILATAERPLVLFPEGTVFRTNDMLQPLLDGVAFLARAAARKRDKMGQGRVVIHPVGIKYLFRGDVVKSVEPVVQRLENRLTWFTGVPTSDTMLKRVIRLREAFLAIKEIEYLGSAQSGGIAERQQALVEQLLGGLEDRWFGRVNAGETIIPRIKQLRLKMVPQLLKSSSLDEKRSIRADLAKVYVSQQVSSYPAEYLTEPTNTQLLETVEQLDEDISGQAAVLRPIHAILEIAPAIEVEPSKPGRNEQDPILRQLDACLRQMLWKLSQEAEPLSSS